MQVIKQLEEVQKTILNLQNSKNYYEKQYAVGIKDNEELRKQIDKLNKCLLFTSIGLFGVFCAFIYTLLLLK